MKKCISLFLIAVICLHLCACGSPSPAEPVTETVTAPATEPLPDITVHAMVPENWESVGCWAWKTGGPDAFAAWPGENMTYAGDGWYEVSVPGWADSVIINGNNGSLQTADLSVEAGKDLWIHVVNSDYAFVHYDEPTNEQLEEERDKPALDYHESVHAVLLQGGYQVAGTKAVVYNDKSERYSVDYLPEELQTDNPKEIYYVIHLVNSFEIVGYYLGLGETKAAIRPEIMVRIQEVGSDKILVESDVFEGGEPPQSISSDQEAGYGTDPDPVLIAEWIQQAIADIANDVPAELPLIPLNEEALPSAERALLDARRLVEEYPLSYEGLVEKLTTDAQRSYTAEEAKAAADNCGANWKENALLVAKSLMERRAYARGELISLLVTSDKFTEEEAVYAADNCGVNWKEIALKVAKDAIESDEYSYSELLKHLTDWKRFSRDDAVYAVNNCGIDWGDMNSVVVQEILAKQPDAIDGYYSRDGLVNCLVKTKGMGREEAAAAADACGLDWMKQALMEAQRLVDTDYAIGYSESGMREHLGAGIDDNGRGFSQEEVTYAMANVQADWAKEAVKRAAFYLEYVSSDYTREEMVNDLVSLCGFSPEDAAYGAEMNGLK